MCYQESQNVQAWTIQLQGSQLAWVSLFRKSFFYLPQQYFEVLGDSDIRLHLASLPNAIRKMNSVIGQETEYEIKPVLPPKRAEMFASVFGGAEGEFEWVVSVHIQSSWFL